MLDEITNLFSACRAHRLLADAWATAQLVLGERDGPALARERGIDALFAVRDGLRLEDILIAS
ncbi:hypothetical protein [Massilia scottii]|uniref:hypothetical protein n=1 Tax=Massilia scottii TaxID=3057166 RepID=UPI0035B54E43